MTSKIFEVKDKFGIHVRVACEILRVVKESECVLFAKKIEKSNCDVALVEIKYPLALVAMQARFSEKIEFSVKGDQEKSEKNVLILIENILNTPSIV